MHVHRQSSYVHYYSAHEPSPQSGLCIKRLQELGRNVMHINANQKMQKHHPHVCLHDMNRSRVRAEPWWDTRDT